MQEPTVPHKRQLENRIHQAISDVEALRRSPVVSVLDLEAAWSEVDAIRDELARL